MESGLIWLITIALLLAFFIPYFLKFRRAQRLTLDRKKEAESMGVGRPRSQYPLIDAAYCIGCGSCVEACPEGDVLGVVYGKATIINGERCVGHGYCEQVCPVGAIKVGLGDIKTREDIPVLNDYFESNVPGLFVAGELGGISLIRNAITQGRTAVERIAELRQDSGRNAGADCDLIIVGGGPAGLSAALTAIEKDLSYIVIDQQEPGGTILQYPRRKLVMTQPVEIPLYGRLEKDEYSKETLLDIWTKLISKFKLRVQANEKVENLQQTENLFKIQTQQAEYKAPFVVLAMGRRGTPRKLGVPGEDKAKVAYQLLDAQSYNNNDLLVVGGGDSAVEAAVGLARQSKNRVHLSYRKSKLFKIKKKNEDRINELIDQDKIKPLFNSNVISIDDKSVNLKIGDDITEIPNDYVFVFAGGIPPFDMLKQVGIQFGGEARKIA